MSLVGRASAYLRFLAGLPAFLRTPLDVDQARARIAQRREKRTATFLKLVQRAVFGSTPSPYRSLFKAAGCQLGDLRQSIDRCGLEGSLTKLADAGVRISFDQFKGRARGADGRPSFRSEEFDNPFLSAGLVFETGGSSGRGIRTQHDLDFLRARATYEAVMIEMMGLRGKPLAVWYPRLPASTGFNNSLRYAKLGQAPERWFQMLEDRKTAPGLDNRLAMVALNAVAKFSGRPLAPPQIAELDEILDWVLSAQERAGRCGLQSYVSQAVRIAQLARQRGRTLDRTVFIVGSEPLGPRRYEELRASGAEVYSRYMATEVGSIAMGCRASRYPDDHHLVSDTIAAIQPDGAGTALCYTSILAESPKILINVELGDAGQLEERECGCEFGALGLKTHVRQIRGVAVAGAAGMTVGVEELTRISEEVLAPRYDGSALDFQWVECEDDLSQGRLLLRIDPRLGAVEEKEVVKLVLEAMRGGASGRRLIAEMWRERGTVGVLRESPRRTAAGKLLALTREQRGSEK